MQSRVSRVDRFKFASVELLVQKQLAVIRQSIETAGNALNESVLCQLRKSVTRMALRSYIELGHRSGREVSLISHRLKDALINWTHPFSPLANHAISLGAKTHSSTDRWLYGAILYIFMAISASYSA